MLDFSQDHFALFGLSPGYQLDEDALAERYRALQQRVHPDRFAGGSDQEKRLSMQASIRINEAYQVLRDPLRRAQYLVDLWTREGDAQGETSQDHAFLLEQMALRERLAQVKDQADPYDALGRILDALQDQEDQLIQELARHLEGAPEPEDLRAARERIQKLQFVNRCRTEAEQIEADLDASL